MLHHAATYHRVLESDGIVQAFLLALRPGAPYDSPNYCWFSLTYADFLYIDRVVVSASMQGRGAGMRLYDDLFQFARSSDITLITCEFDVEPPNPASERLHRRLGFREVGTQSVGPNNKRVSLQALTLKE
jgi:predicted GNAT superfamily acetyltransferase